MRVTVSVRRAMLAALACALPFAALPATAWADDPHDASMRSAQARARDHELTRQLNLQQGAMVRERDARYGQGYGAAASGSAEYTSSNAQYQREMAQWRRAVSACRAGDYSACAR